MADHAPYSHAFDELALPFYLELLEDAARYQDASTDMDEIGDGADDDEDETAGDGDSTVADTTSASAQADRTAGEAPAARSGQQRSLWQRSLDLFLAQGYVLRTKADGWTLLCERLRVPPFLL